MSGNDDQKADSTSPAGRTSVLLGEPIIWSVVFILIVSSFFLALPGIDIWFSGLFYDPAIGFPLSRIGALTLLRKFGHWVTIAVVVSLFAALIIKLAQPMRPAPIQPRYIVFLLSALAVGPGLIVNVVLKEQWGRPRPDTIDLFGGEAPYVTVWRISDYCLGNCSFVSGEASSAIWLVAAAIIVPARWRGMAASLLFALAVALSFNRVAFGRHFLSDILLAWGLTFFVIATLHRAIVARPPGWMRNDRLEARLARLGMRLRPGSRVGDRRD